MIERCRNTYANMYVVMVISGEHMTETIQAFFHRELPYVLFQIVDYNPYEENFQRFVKEKRNDPEYITNFIRYKHMRNNALHEINNASSCIMIGCRQHYQLEIGIETILAYEKSHSIQFDMFMRTRFDVLYPEGVYPHIPSGIYEKLTFHGFGMSEKKFSERMSEGISGYIHFLKTQTIQHPECRVKDYETSLGGAYFYNYITVEHLNTHPEERNILYMFNDFLYFAERDIFLKLMNFNDMWGKVPTYGMQHTFAPEAQMLMLCFHTNIYPLMYHPEKEMLIR
jgi:hypothetical protein